MTRGAILVVAPYLPWPADFGGALRIYHLVLNLAIDHDVLLCAPGAANERDALDTLGKICDVTVIPARWTPRQPAGRQKRFAQMQALVAGRSCLEQSACIPRMQAVINRLFLTRRIDLVQFEFSQMGIYTTPRPCPTVIDVHNVEHLLLQRIAATSPSDLKRAFNTIEHHKVRTLERRTWSRASLCVATSAPDATLVEALSGTPTLVVPNGVDVAYFSAVERRPVRPLVVFTGAMRHASNADGARWYLDNVHARVRSRIDDVEVAIVGADPPPDLVARGVDGIDVTGTVPDVRPWFARASVAVVPLLSGGGTRLKILEALAAGVPVVSTTIGAEGLELRPDSDILLADSPQAFADAIVRVIHDPELSGRLAERGQAIVRDRFDWSVVSHALVSAHDVAIERFEQRS